MKIRYLSTMVILVISTMATTNVFAQTNESGPEPQPVKDWLANHPNFTGCVHTDLKTGESKEVSCIHPELSPMGTYEPQNSKHVMSPLKQFMSGVASKDIKCAPDLQVVIKARNHFPACVKPEDVSKFVQRGWADKLNSLQEQLDLANSCIGSNDACGHRYDSQNITKKIQYYGNSNQKPKVSLYDYLYDGIDKDGLVSIDNQTFYETTLDNDIYKLKGISVQFHNVTFSFPEGTLSTPGGAFVNLDVKFQDGFEETYGGTMPSSDDSSTMVGGIPIPSKFGPPAITSITVLGNHTNPQAGLTIYQDKVKLLVSGDNQTSPTIPQCVSNIQNQYAVAGPQGDTLCPVVNFQASGKIINYTGFYGVYEYPEYLGTPNFVLEPGHNGTLSYTIDIGSIYNWGNEPPTNKVNITNDLEFMHDAGMHDHPGVTTSVDSKSEIIQKNGSAFVTIKFAATTDARPGTYWIYLPPGFCAGGKTIILTITNCEK